MGVFGPNRWKGDSAVPLITLVINRNQFKDGSMSSETQVRDACMHAHLHARVVLSRRLEAG